MSGVNEEKSLSGNEYNLVENAKKIEIKDEYMQVKISKDFEILGRHLSDCIKAEEFL